MRSVVSKNKPPAKPNNHSQKQVYPHKIVTETHHQSRTIFDPEIVSRYAKMVPDAPNRILAVFEKNAEIERRVIIHPVLESKRRDWMGFSLTVVLIMAAIVFA